MNSNLKNIFVGIIGGITVAEYPFFGDKKNFNSDQTIPKSYILTDNPTEVRPFLNSGEEDRDCGDFRTQREAQLFFEANGGSSNDAHNLDCDSDGRVCESLP